MYKILIAVLLTAFTAAQSFASDVAERQIIGFSANGKYFAFVEYGEQDGSGFPFANLFAINLDKDSWVKGTPIKVLIKDDSDNTSVADALQKAHKKARKILKKRGIRHPGTLLASNPVTEEIKDPEKVIFSHNHHVGELDSFVSIETFDLPAPSNCEGWDETKGFALSYSLQAGPVKEIYRDTSIPKSRNCPLDYKIADIIAFDAFDKDEYSLRLVAFIHKYSPGFEGQDVNFLAVPIQ
jgi:predicted secreted protein